MSALASSSCFFHADLIAALSSCSLSSWIFVSVVDVAITQTPPPVVSLTDAPGDSYRSSLAGS